MKKIVFLLSVVGLTASLSACDTTDTIIDPLVIPATYDGTAYAANAATELQVRKQFDELINEVKRGRTGATLDAAKLTQLYTAGSPNLQTIGSPAYQTTVALAFPEIVKASGKVYKWGELTGNGGVNNGYLFDETGLELEQVIDKSFYGAGLYNHALTLLSQPLSSASTDKLIAVWGAHPDFVNSNNATTYPQTADKYMANYAARRDQKDGKGIYTAIQNDFIKLQAAINGGDNYTRERNEAVASLKLNWEKANAATVINYLYDASSKLSATTVTDATKAAAIHTLSECVGFMSGWAGVAQASRKITDAQISQQLAAYNMSATQSELYKFATAPASELPDLQTAIKQLQSIYGFTDAELEGFKKNWVTEQKR